MKHTKDNPKWETNLMSKTTWVTVALGAVAVMTLILAITVPRGDVDHTITKTDDVSPASSAPVEPLADRSAYFTIRKDVRRCAAPMCGGYFVRRANNQRMKCSNQRAALDCYVAEIDWNGNTKVEPSRALLRGEIVDGVKSRAGKFDRLRVLESWQGAGKNATSEFYRVRDLRINCITHPCMTHHEARLNSTFERDIAGVELNSAGASDAVIQEAVQAMRSQEGILISGSHRRETGPAGTAETLIASQIYLRAMGDTASTKPCMRTGCSGQVCSDQDVMTTCEYRTEYECYKKATCERQTNGECGWTQTKELTSCLKGRK
jgi:eight-cysteine-cluster-containing protein